MRICAEKLQTRKQRDEKAKGRESKRTRKQKDEKSRRREAAEKQNPGWAEPRFFALYLLFVVGLMVEIGSEKLNRVRRRGCLAVFAKAARGQYDEYRGRFIGPWHTRIHAFLYDYTHLHVSMYTHTICKYICVHIHRRNTGNRQPPNKKLPSYTWTPGPKKGEEMFFTSSVHPVVIKSVFARCALVQRLSTFLFSWTGYWVSLEK